MPSKLWVGRSNRPGITKWRHQAPFPFNIGDENEG